MVAELSRSESTRGSTLGEHVSMEVCNNLGVGGRSLLVQHIAVVWSSGVLCCS
jgi:hypothetical protein